MQRLAPLLATALALALCAPLAPAARQGASLPGSVRLLVDRDPAAPRVAGSVRFEAGGMHEPADKAGLVTVLAGALRFGGSRARTAFDVEEWLDKERASLSIAGTPERVSIDFECAPDRLGEMLGIVRDLVLDPAYSADAVRRSRAQAIEDLRAEADHPNAIADRLLIEVAYGIDSPHARFASPGSVRRVTREDVLAFHTEHLVRNRMWVGLAGAVPEDAQARVDAALGVLREGTPTEHAKTPFRAPEETSVWAIVHPGAVAAQVRFAAPGIDASDADVPALRLWADALCGPGSPALWAGHGLEHGSAGAFFRPRWGRRGEMLGFLSTESAEPAKELAAMLEGLEHLRTEQLDGAVLDAARARVSEADAMLAGDLRARLVRDLELAMEGLDDGFWESHGQRLAALTPAQVAEASARRATTEKLVIVAVVANEDAIAGLEQFGPVTRLPDYTGPRGPEDALALRARMFAAMGGERAWARATSIYVEGEASVAGLSQKVTVRIWRDLTQSRLRIAQITGGGQVEQIVTEDGAWQLAGDQVASIDAARDRVLYREERQLVRVLRDLVVRSDRSVRIGEGGRLEVLAGDELFCWLILGDDDRPLELGAPPAPDGKPLRYRFDAWRDSEPFEWPGGPDAVRIPYPSSVTQPDDGAGFRWTHFAPKQAEEEALYRIPGGG